MPYGKTNIDKVLREAYADRELWNMRVLDIAIEDIVWRDRARQEPGNIDALAASIKDAGLIHPIVIDTDHVGIAGWRRWSACQRLGWESIRAYVVSPYVFAEVKDYRRRAERIENALRKELTPGEVARQLERIDEEEKAAARERMREGGRRGGSGQGSAKLDDPSGGKAFDIACERVGIKPSTAKKIVAAYQARDEHPDILEQMDKKGLGKIDGPYKELRRRQQLQQVRDVPPPVGIYRTIVIDPPWPTDKRFPSEGEDPVLAYSLMTVEEIEQKVGAILEQCAEKDGCHIYLWTIHAFVPQAFKLLEAWGVQYRSRLLSWEKLDEQGRTTGGNPAMTFRPVTEFVLFGGLGSLPLKKIAIPTHFRAVRREHSRKPDEFYEIVKQASPGPYLDVFGRGGHGQDWQSWGLEANKFDQVESPV